MQARLLKFVVDDGIELNQGGMDEVFVLLTDDACGRADGVEGLIRYESGGKEGRFVAAAIASLSQDLVNSVHN